jgi:hypothetical protein
VTKGREEARSVFWAEEAVLSAGSGESVERVDGSGAGEDREEGRGEDGAVGGGMARESMW